VQLDAHNGQRLEQSCAAHQAAEEIMVEIKCDPPGLKPTLILRLYAALEALLFHGAARICKFSMVT